MKTLRFIGMALLAVLICVNFASCSSEDNIPSTDEQEFYTVKIGLTGEILNITDEPLSRAEGESESTNNIYGIQIYSTPNKDLEKGETAIWTAYAYGLFNDPENISVNLVKGYHYKFVATMVVDGKNKISSDNDEYHRPFANNNSVSVKLTNNFDYTATTYFDWLNNGLVNLKNIRGSYYRPNVDRYYGEFIYEANKSEEVNIPMKRTSFGASFVVINSISKDGKVEIGIEKAPGMEISFTSGELNEFWAKDIYSFEQVKDAFDNNDYTEKVPVSIKWTRNDGSSIPLGSHEITYKRNRNTIVTIKIINMGADKAVGYSIEENEKVGIDDMVEEGNTTIEDGEIVNTPVTPN